MADISSDSHVPKINMDEVLKNPKLCRLLIQLNILELYKKEGDPQQHYIIFVEKFIKYTHESADNELYIF